MADKSFESSICEKCLNTAASAGQLMSIKARGDRTPLHTLCDQCGKPLIDGEVYRVVLEP
jgi:hypothetical protein